MRIGLAGCGRIGAMHAEVLRELSDVKEIVVADLDLSRSAEVAERLKVSMAESVDDLLSSGLDGIVIATATDSHAELVVRSAAAGLPTFCEKPVAADVEGTLAVITSIAGWDVPVQIGFQRRFDPGHLMARNLVQSGRLGRIHSIRAVTSDPTPPPESFIATAGGLFRDCLVHDFDSIRWMTGREIVSVYARGSNNGADFFARHGDVDTAAVLLTLDDGSLATVSSTRYNGAGYDVRLEVLGEKDSVAIGLDHHTALTSMEAGVDFPAGPVWPSFPQRFAQAYRAEFEAFVDLAREGGSSPCTAEDALEAFYVAEAAEMSRRDNRPVELGEVRR